MVMSSVCLSVCDAVHCGGAQDRCRGLKVVPRDPNSLFTSLDFFVVQNVAFSHKTQRSAKILLMLKSRLQYEIVIK